MEYMQVRIIHNNNKITFITNVYRVGHTKAVLDGSYGEERYDRIWVHYMLNKNDTRVECVALKDIKTFVVETMEEENNEN